jgi:SAM-dependent methyltransferase
MEVLMTDVVEWDVANWSHAVKYWEASAPLHGEPLECMELGAHHGGLSLWLASLGHRVLCTDLQGVEASARPLHERYGLSELVAYQELDATAIPFREHFDIIVFKSMLGAVGSNGNIDRKRAAARAIYSALKPGGRLLFAENLAASPLHCFFRERYVQWGRYWSYSNILEMQTLLHQFSHLEFNTVGFLGAFGRSEAQRRLLSAFDCSKLAARVPEKWRYIMYGIATK